MDETDAKNFLTMLQKKAEPESPGDEDDSKKKPNQSETLLQLAEVGEYFHDSEGNTFGQIPIGNHFEVWQLGAKSFRRWLTGKFYQTTGKAPNPDAIRQAVGVLEARATFDGPRADLSLRIAEHDGAFWYDMADERWRAVRITPEGWGIVEKPPALFRRFANTAAQVEPERVNGREILNMLDFVNLKDDGQKLLFLVELVSCLIPEIPHVVSVLHGEKGSSKSTTMRIRRKLVDPANQELQILPRDQNELALILSKNWLPSFDNIDGLPSAISDVLCVASTGGGISKRELYSDDSEVILNFKRCVSLNGITAAASKPDLLDRALVFELERIPENRRKTEAEFWQDFEEMRARILGGMFQVLADAMAIRPGVKLASLHRMADWQLWGYALAEAIYSGGGQDFLKAFDANRKRGNEEALAANPVAGAIVSLMANRQTWQGTAADLLEDLEAVGFNEKIDMKAKSWPRSAKSLAKRIKHIRSNILDAGFEFSETWDVHLKRSVYSLSLKVGN